MAPRSVRSLSNARRGLLASPVRSEADEGRMVLALAGRHTSFEATQIYVRRLCALDGSCPKEGSQCLAVLKAKSACRRGTDRRQRRSASSKSTSALMSLMMSDRMVMTSSSCAIKPSLGVEKTHARGFMGRVIFSRDIVASYASRCSK